MITAIVLTKNEEIHLGRCLDSLASAGINVCVVDSGSTDSTIDIAKAKGAEVYYREWTNYAEQFQWAIDNCDIDTDWIMRMDADEYLEIALVEEIRNKMGSIDSAVNGIYLKRKVLFKGRWIKHGAFYPHILLRIWRYGAGRIEQRWMDEHMVLDKPNTVMFENDVVDCNLNNITWWTNKHNSYASREAIDLLNMKYKFLNSDDGVVNQGGSQEKWKRILKEKVYRKLPASIRSTFYFIYRYVFMLGFLDGKEGFYFHFLQGFWYRLLVDVKVHEIESLISLSSTVTDEIVIDAILDVTGIDLRG